MPSDVLSCPYCNTPAAPPANARPGQRISCSRCGESFPYRGSGESTPVTASPMPAPPPPPIAAPRRFSNGEIGRFVLGVMVVMAVIGLTYALSTQGIRREYDIHLPKTKAISIPVYLMIPLVLFVVGLVGAWFWGWNRRERGDTTAPPARRIWGLMGLSALVLVVVELAMVVMQARTPRPAELESLPPVHAVPPAELAALGYSAAGYRSHHGRPRRGTARRPGRQRPDWAPGQREHQPPERRKLERPQDGRHRPRGPRPVPR